MYDCFLKKSADNFGPSSLSKTNPNVTYSANSFMDSPADLY